MDVAPGVSREGLLRPHGREIVSILLLHVTKILLLLKQVLRYLRLPIRVNELTGVHPLAFLEGIVAPLLIGATFTATHRLRDPYALLISA